jgi:hypothetical protein
MAKNPESFSVTLSMSTKDKDLKISQIAQMLKDGVALDPNNLIVLKGKPLLMYALKDFYKRWVEDKKPQEIKEETKTNEQEIAPQKKKSRNFGAIEPLNP